MASEKLKSVKMIINRRKIALSLKEVQIEISNTLEQKIEGIKFKKILNGIMSHDNINLLYLYNLYKSLLESLTWKKVIVDYATRQKINRWRN